MKNVPTAVLPPSPVGPAEPSHQAMEQAAGWYALLRCGEATEAERSNWQAWLDGHPDHRRAWGYVEAVSRSFEPIHATPDPRLTADKLWAANTRVLQRRRALVSITGLAGTGLLGWATWRHTPLPGIALAWAADHRTATGEMRMVTLSDGTRIWLNTATAFNEDYRTSLRRLRLVAGEILIDTAADPLRPFFVDTPQGRLQALGTSFTVRLDDGETFLAVYQGAVEVRTTGANASAVIRAGQQIRFSADALTAPEAADAAREAWSRGMLVAKDIPLGDVVKELRRYRSGHLGVAPAVAGLRVFGNFPLYDTDETLAMLATALPIGIHRHMNWWVSIEPKDMAPSTSR